MVARSEGQKKFYHFFEFTEALTNAGEALFHPLSERLPLWNPLAKLDVPNLMETEPGLTITQVLPTGGPFFDVLLSNGDLKTLVIFNVSGQFEDGTPLVRYQPVFAAKDVSFLFASGGKSFAVKKDGSYSEAGSPMRFFGAGPYGTGSSKLGFMLPTTEVDLRSAQIEAAASDSADDFLLRFSPDRIAKLQSEGAEAQTVSTYLEALAQLTPHFLSLEPSAEQLQLFLEKLSLLPGPHPSQLEATLRKLVSFALEKADSSYGWVRFLRLSAGSEKGTPLLPKTLGEVLNDHFDTFLALFPDPGSIRVLETLREEFPERLQGFWRYGDQVKERMSINGQNAVRILVTLLSEEPHSDTGDYALWKLLAFQLAGSECLAVSAKQAAVLQKSFAQLQALEGRTAALGEHRLEFVPTEDGNVELKVSSEKIPNAPRSS